VIGATTHAFKISLNLYFIEGPRGKREYIYALVASNELVVRARTPYEYFGGCKHTSNNIDFVKPLRTK
jgi:hypothetical protein